ncbi:hypothetical protein NRF20_16705 [Streptomyces sp. R-74717]
MENRGHERRVVDSTQGYVGVYRGKPALGRAYASHLVEKGARYFQPQG